MTETESGVRSTRWRRIAAIWLAYGLFDASHTVLFMQAVGGTRGSSSSERVRVLAALGAGDSIHHQPDAPTPDDPRVRLYRRSPCTSRLSSSSAWSRALVRGASDALQPVASPQSPTFTEAWSTSLALSGSAVTDRIRAYIGRYRHRGCAPRMVRQKTRPRGSTRSSPKRNLRRYEGRSSRTSCSTP